MDLGEVLLALSILWACWVSVDKRLKLYRYAATICWALAMFFAGLNWPEVAVLPGVVGLILVVMSGEVLKRWRVQRRRRG